MEYIRFNNAVSKVSAKTAKGIIMEMCCDSETTKLTLITDGKEPMELYADDTTSVYNMCKFTSAIEDAIDIDEIAIVIANSGLAGNKSRVLVVLPLVNEA